jgi:hypothetical protein
MSRKDLFIGNFDFVFIAFLLVLSLGVGASLLQPRAAERHGVVEIYSLSNADQRAST